ncbi:MAG: hypothetical protein K2H37_10925 [Lachnospiraceae bacterium]|nr:hypothetical protein [Lachnospiraceae bacterium]
MAELINELEQAKKYGNKIEITDIAIKKVRYIEYKGLTDAQNAIMQQLVKEVLFLSQIYNDSNEVAITCDLALSDPLENYGICLGDEHSVDVCSDTQSNHLIVSAKRCTVVILHNHPSLQTFSLDDIRFFVANRGISILVVVSNQGKIHYLYKDEKYSERETIQLFNECVDGLGCTSMVSERYHRALVFLARCSETGLFYS